MELTYWEVLYLLLHLAASQWQNALRASPAFAICGLKKGPRGSPQRGDATPAYFSHFENPSEIKGLHLLFGALSGAYCSCYSWRVSCALFSADFRSGCHWFTCLARYSSNNGCSGFGHPALRLFAQCLLSIRSTRFRCSWQLAQTGPMGWQRQNPI